MARSTSMPIAAAIAAGSRSGCWKKRAWPRRRASTSAPTAPGASCASPIREAWRTWRRPPKESDALFLQLLPDDFEARFLGEHLVGVLGSRLIERAGVHLQRRLDVSEAALVFPQDLRSHGNVHLGIEQCMLPAVVEQLLEMELWDHLHEPLGAGDALGHGVVARLDRGNRKNEERIDGIFRARPIGGRNEAG